MNSSSKLTLDRYEINALYHRVVWNPVDGKKKVGQIVMHNLVKKHIEELGLMTQIHPIHPPMVCPPQPWYGAKEGGAYLLHT